MSKLDFIKSKENHVPPQLKSVRLMPDASIPKQTDSGKKKNQPTTDLMKDFEHMAGEYKKTDAASPASKPHNVMSTAHELGWSTPAMGQTKEEEKHAVASTKKRTMSGASGAHITTHGGDVVSSAGIKPPSVPAQVMKPGATVAMQSVAKPKSEKVASKSFADAMKALEKAAEKQEKHYGMRQGTRDPKGSMPRIKKYKTKGGKIRKPPEGDESREEMAAEMIAHHMHHLGRHPGGKKQAIAIGLHQAGMSKKSMKPGRDEEMWATDSMKSCTPIMKGSNMDKSFDELLDMSKAMTARNMPRYPRPLRAQYEKDIYRSAMDIPTNKNSRLAKDIPTLAAGYLKPDVLAQLRRDEEERTHREMHKSNELQDCKTCGRIFSKSFAECPTCVISKSSMCKACGHQMVKGRDGQLRCSICG